MSMFLKRFGLMLLVNIAVMVVVSFVLSLVGLNGTYYRQGGLSIDYRHLAAFCLVWGMVGSFISLLLSKALIKWTMKVRTVLPTTTSSEERRLYETVARLAREAGLAKTPEVGIYASMEVNAFATGPSRRNSLVAVSEGLLRQMSRQEVEAVLAHEIGHVANGDMVTMALLQGVINAFVLFAAKVASFFIRNAMRAARDEESSGPDMLQFWIEIAFQIVFGIIGSMVVARFSRYREFRADAASARLVGALPMIAALKRLESFSSQEPSQGQEMVAAFKISNNSGPGRFLQLLATHPPLRERIRALETGQIR